MKNNSIKRATLISGLLLVLLLSACKDSLEDSVYRTSDVQMIDEYLADTDNELTDFHQIVTRSKYKGMLHAYGAYTCFAPTNEAVRIYMSAKNKTIDQLTQEEASEIVGYHVVNATTNTLSFIEGRLSAANLINYYVTTHTQTDEDGQAFYQIDRKARILTKDVEVGNGIIHILDAMLEKPAKKLKEQIEELPDERFSILKELFAETDLYTSVLGAEATNGNFYTVFLHDNQSFIEAEVETRDKLLRQLRLNNPFPEMSSDKELIENFMAYHIGESRVYVRDLTFSSYVYTHVAGQGLNIQRNKDNTILINEFKVGAYNEEGIPVKIDSEYADLSCSNGITQEVSGVLQLRKRGAYRVNFDVTEQPEFMALPDFRKELLEKRQFNSGSLSEIMWHNSGNVISYLVSTSWTSKYTAAEQMVYGDYMTLRLGANNCKYLQYQTPFLMKGRYKVWLCYYSTTSATSSGTPQFQATFIHGEDMATVVEEEKKQVLPTVVVASRMTLRYTDNATIDHETMEQEGWKQYNAREPHTNMASRLLGTVEITTDGRHYIRFDAQNNASSNISFDMIQFIPEDEDQIWPMIDMAGNLIYEDTPSTDIWPYN